ncbi:MAG: phosphoribosylglycinamide synthetase C domain-containing protein, partial [Pseudomonadota bacterium]
MLFHAGTLKDDGKVLANGGRVLNATGRGATLEEAHQRAYALAEQIKWKEGFYRKDIGWRVLGKS